MDGGILAEDGAVLEAQNGFSVFQDVEWTSLGGGMLQGKFIVGILENGQTKTGDMDLVKFALETASYKNQGLFLMIFCNENSKS